MAVNIEDMMAEERAAVQNQDNVPLKFTTLSDVYNGLQRQPSDGGARMMLFDARKWDSVQRGRIRGAVPYLNIALTLILVVS